MSPIFLFYACWAPIWEWMYLPRLQVVDLPPSKRTSSLYNFTAAFLKPLGIMCFMNNVLVSRLTVMTQMTAMKVV